MTVTIRALIGAKQLESAQTTQYTASGVRAIIDKATVTNTSGANVALSVNIVASGGTVGDGNLIIKAKTIMPGETYTCPELVGQVLEPGGFVSTLAGAATSLTMRVSGREVA
jgi:hypothetical protein